MTSAEEYLKWVKENHPGYFKHMERKAKEIEETKRKREADAQRHLKRMEEIENGPPIPYPIISCTIPSPPVQEVTSLKVYPSFPIIKTSIISPPIQKSH